MMRRDSFTSRNSRYSRMPPPLTGGSGTGVGDGYFFMLKPLPPGPHTIHYGGRFHIPANAGGPFDIVKDTTLMITVGP